MVTASFKEGQKTAITTSLQKYDYGEVLRIKGLSLPRYVAVQFAVDGMSEALPSSIGETVEDVTDVLIPNSLLRSNIKPWNYNIMAYVYIVSGSSGKTEYTITIPVKWRPKTGDDQAADDDVAAVIGSAVEKMNTATTKAENAANHATETAEEIKADREKITTNEIKIAGLKSDMVNTNDFLFSLIVDKESGIVPIYIKKGDTVTFSTLDDRNFDDGALFFYDMSQRNISGSGWKLSSSLSQRMVVIKFATDDDRAYYVSTTSQVKIKVTLIKTTTKFFDINNIIVCEENTQDIKKNVNKLDAVFHNVLFVSALNFVNFALGGIDSNGNIIYNQTFRVYSDLLKIEFDSIFTIDEGKRYGIHYYNNDDGSHLIDTGWMTKPYTVKKDSLIRITISNTLVSDIEESKYQADINVLPNVVKIQNAIATAIESNAKVCEENTQDIKRNTQITENFDSTKWLQGTLYNGNFLASNKKCLTYSDYFNCVGIDHIKFIRNNLDNSVWNIRCSFFGSEYNFISQDGYSKADTFAVPEKAAFVKISISLILNGNPDITPEDYTEERVLTPILYMNSLIKPVRKAQEEIALLKEDIFMINNNIPSDAVSGYYSGEKIVIKQNMLAYKKYMQVDASIFGRQPIQGCAQYNDLLFVTCNTMSTIAIFNLLAKTLIGTISFSPISTYHCNSMNFGVEKYANDDEFPLLYISMENIAEHKMIAMRILRDSDSYSGEIKQTITYPVPSESIQYFPNGSLDNENGFLFVKGYTQNNYIAGNGNTIRVRKWLMPKLSDGDVTLNTADALQTFEVPALNCTQGEVVVNGKLIGCYGANWAGDKSIHIAMIDPNQERMITDIIMNTVGYNQEPEALFVWNDELYILDVNGIINKLYFN